MCSYCLLLYRTNIEAPIISKQITEARDITLASKAECLVITSISNRATKKKSFRIIVNGDAAWLELLRISGQWNCSSGILIGCVKLLD